MSSRPLAALASIALMGLAQEEKVRASWFAKYTSYPW
jgi:hypothetical protein